MNNVDDNLSKLIKQVSNKCYITSDDELIRDRITQIVKNAIYSVKSLIGISETEEFDFSKEGRENELFLNYCMYRWNNKSQKDFETNYMGDIISVRSKYEVEYSKSLDEGNNNNE